MLVNKIIPRIKFGSKAETLDRIRPYVHGAIIDDLLFFTVKEWLEDRGMVLKKINGHFLAAASVIIRSSAVNEDCLGQSNAGHFCSVMDVNPKDPSALEAGIEEVVASYVDNNPDNQFFIQPFLKNVEMSGVVFSRDINTFAPYITINYDDQTGLTDTVTSGRGQNTHTLVLFKEKCYELNDDRIVRLYDTIIELEKLFGNDALDIEFVFKNGDLHILQVRPIVRRANETIVPDTAMISSTLQQIYNRIEELNSPHPDLYGKETLYGIMPDWNPAEMIGIKPRQLALSLYRELITDNIWAYQRDNYGYKKLRSFPLLVSFAGHPYIDVRVDFNSWIPKVLNDELSHKLADFYISKLKRKPESHDKVEFDIVYTCYTFDLDQKLKELLEYGFVDSELHEIKSSLLELTKNIIGSKDKEGLYRQDLTKIDILEKRREELLKSDLSEINKIYWLVEDCKRYGTLPFAGIARAGFVAVLFLNSLVSLEIISLREKNLFINSLNTVAKQLSHNIRDLKAGRLSVENFITKFGHLRPGTYDIMLDSYEDNFDKYFDLSKLEGNDAVTTEDQEPFTLSEKQNGQIQELLDRHQLGINVEQFFIFLKEAIEGREYAKFSFTKSVSKLLNIVKKYGESIGFGTDDMSFTEIGTLMKLYSTVAFFDERELLAREIDRNKNLFNFFRYLKLPHLITKSEDIFAFYLDNVEPNYITTGTVEGEIVVVNSEIDKLGIEGRVVFIENADPGFDWIFSHSIKGLVTAYGGANSHMSIRAAELNIPGVIGCGPVLFEKWSSAKKLKIDCGSKMVVILS